MKTQQKTELQISLSGNTSTLEFLLNKKMKENGVKNLHATFTITAKEVANRFGKTVQEIYMFLDELRYKGYESTHKPILVKGKDWEYIKGRIHLSEESVEVLKEWIEKRRLTKKEKV